MHGTLQQEVKLDWRSDELDAYQERFFAECRQSFWKFRQYMHPELVEGWWVEHAAGVMQEFWNDFCDGKRPKLILMAPPQHGKSMTIEDFICWAAGRAPYLKQMFASYSEDLGERANRAVQRLLDSDRYKLVFPNTRLAAPGTRVGGGRHMRNLSLLEFVGYRGQFRNTTVEGQITGQALDLGYIDDPIKGRKDASSEVKRNSTWNWLTDDFFSRFSNYAAFLMVLTRWHVDDPAGRFIEKFPNTKLVRYPAIAEKNDWSVKEGFRDPGEPLFPQYKSLEFLLERKSVYSIGAWESIYQQNPIIVGGGLFPIERFVMISEQNGPERKKVRRSVRYWDKAGTEDGGAYTAGVLMHMLDDGRFIIEDVRRGQWSALERERRILQTSQSDRGFCQHYEIWVEQEPGSSGKDVAEASVRMLKGFKAYADKVTGEKEYRAEPYAAQVQHGNVMIMPAEWNSAFFDEHEAFPNSKYKDQVDAAAGAFMKLAVPASTYRTSLDWIG